MPCFEYPPPPSLQDDIQCFWVIQSDPEASAVPQILAADAGADIALAMTNPACAFVIGPRSEPLELPPPEDKTTLFGIRFWPGAIARYLPKGQSAQLLNQILDASELWPEAMQGVFDSLPSTPDKTMNWQLFLPLLEQRRNTNTKTIEHVVKACKLIRYSAGDVMIAELAEALSISQRSLQRAFMDTIGLSPKQVARISRFRQSCSSMSEHPDIQLSQSYSDQAHAIKEFKALGASTPKELLAKLESGELLQYDPPAHKPVRKP